MNEIFLCLGFAIVVEYVQGLHYLKHILISISLNVIF
jgi:hypothetical protein